MKGGVPVAFGTDVPHMPRWGRPLLYGPGSILDAHTEHEKVRKQDIEEQAAKLGTKLIFPTVLLFFPVIFALAGLLPLYALYTTLLLSTRIKAERGQLTSAG